MNVVSRAKFKLTDRTEHHWSPTVKTLVFHPVCDDATEENRKFHRYTPSGHLSLMLDNPALDNVFVLGKEYYLDFTPVD